jgi:hypothetical protein
MDILRTIDADARPNPISSQDIEPVIIETEPVRLYADRAKPYA